MENYSFWTVHKAPRKPWEKTVWWIARCKSFHLLLAGLFTIATNQNHNHLLLQLQLQIHSLQCYST